VPARTARSRGNVERGDGGDPVVVGRSPARVRSRGNVRGADGEPFAPRRRIAALLRLHPRLDAAYEQAIADPFTSDDLGL
jgi:hypothetical protein